MATSSSTNDPEFEQFSLALLNINSLRYKTDDIRHIITHHRLHVLALCETNLDSTVKDSQVYIEGFRMWRRDRNSDGGGVALYVQDHIETKLRSDLIKTKVEMIWVEMELPESKPVLLGCCYRRPIAKKEDMVEIENIMTLVSIEKEDKEILLMGDFNIDWKSENKKRKMSFMSDLGFEQIVDDYTKLTPESKTCIDHIYTNIPHQCSKPKSTVTGCSNHNLVTVMVNKNIPKRIRRSGLKETFDLNEFKKDLESALRENRQNAADPKEALSRFTESFLSVANTYAPLENQDIYGSLRLDDEMESLMSERDQAKQHMLDDKRESSRSERERVDLKTEKEKYKKKRVQKCVRKKQKTSFQQQLQKAKCDPERLFKVFEAFLGDSLPSHVISITPEGDVTAKTEQINFLRQTDSETADLESVSESSQLQQRMQTKNDAFRFRHISIKVVKEWLEFQCDCVICGIDPTEAKLMKVAADHISVPISHILNRFISTKMFPNELKKFLTNNYISSIQSRGADIVHHILGYIFDVILYEQAQQFLTEDQLISSVSLNDEMENLKSDWLRAREANKTVGAVFLDFSSSFNTISHDLLVNKLRTSGFTASALSLIKSFLSDREGSQGLPPGSFLAKLLFAVFINDPKTVLKISSAVICDSYMIIYAVGDSQMIPKELEDEMKSVCKWAKYFHITFDKTRAEQVKSRQMPDIFDILDSLLKRHGRKLNWIYALWNISQQ